MKLYYIVVFIFLCMKSYLTAGSPLKEEASNFLKALIESNLVKVESSGSEPSNYQERLKKAESILIPKILKNLSEDERYISSRELPRLRHSRRETAGSRRIRSWPHHHSRKYPSNRNPCGFFTRLDLISYNPKFGCKRRRKPHSKPTQRR